MKKKVIAGRAGLLLIAAASLTPPALAQTAPADSPKAESTTTPPAAPPAIFSIGGFDLTGHVDVGYSRLLGTGKFANGVNSRVFDFDGDKLNLQAIDLQLAKLPDDGFGGLVDVTIGKDADTIASYGTIDRNRRESGFSGEHHRFPID